MINNLLFSEALRVFTGEGYKGSIQYLHFFDTEESLNHSFEKMNINDDFDHSFVCRRSDGSFYALWRNKTYPIQFCGSGAYALSAYLLNKNNLNNLLIKSSHIEVSAQRIEEAVWLEFPARLGVEIKSINTKGKCFFHQEDRILLFELKNKGQIFEDNLVQSVKEFEDEVDTQCFFYWDEEEASGYLRYFTEKFGREEDYVTGSIHRWLTPLVSQLYKKNDQKWIQCSQGKGELRSRLVDDKVKISGSWQIHTSL